MMEYKIIYCYESYELECEVNEFIKMGWKPLGGPTFAKQPNHGETWSQAMIKKENDANHN